MEAKDTSCPCCFWQRSSIWLILITWLASAALINTEETKADTSEKLIGNLIDTFQLTSLTVIYNEDAPEICFIQTWILCLRDSQEEIELTSHLKNIHTTRKQDSLMIMENYVHKTLLMNLVKIVPTIFTAGCPVFMPIEYVDLIDLRLDSNIIFFESKTSGGYNLMDIFAVKGGMPITLELGNFDMEGGMG